MGQENKYQKLLNEATKIIRENNDIVEKTGKNFNIFNIIGKSSDEVNIHSRFLAELLNPKGTHGCKDSFLKSFLAVLNLKHKFDINSSKVTAEYDIAPISKDGKTGGRIDILISFGKEFDIIIENKIYAGDQPNQLLRYSNFALEKIKDKKIKAFQIYYLTLDGHMPSKDSTGLDSETDLKDKKYWIEISYKEEICQWLQKWLEETDNKKNKGWIYPIVRQYYELVKEITGSKRNNSEIQKIHNLLLNDKNLQLAIDMRKQIDNVKEMIFCKFCQKLGKVANEKFQLSSEYEIEDGNFRRLYLYKHNWVYYFTLELNISNFVCIFGIWLDKRDNKKLAKELRSLQDYRNTNSWWMIWDYPIEKLDSWNSETFNRINNNPNELLSSIMNKIEQCMPKLESLEKKGRKHKKKSENNEPLKLTSIDKLLLIKNNKNLVAADFLCSEIDSLLEKEFKDLVEFDYYDKINGKFVYFCLCPPDANCFQIGFGHNDGIDFDQNEQNQLKDILSKVIETLPKSGKEFHKSKKWVYIDFRFSELNGNILGKIKTKVKRALETMKNQAKKLSNPLS